MSLIKQDLEILRHGNVDGVYHWLVYEPALMEYFLVPDEVVELIRKLGRGETQLTQDEMASYEQLKALGLLRQEAPKPGMLARLQLGLGQLLFLKFPLIQPSEWLRAALIWCLLFTSRPFLLVASVLTLLAWGRVIMQPADLFVWDYQMSDAPLFLVLLCLTKMIHECGHAFSATRFGIPVRTMGVALVFFMPRLYTDVSDMWRTGARQRALISGGGIWAEFIVSGACAWYMSLVSPGGDDWRLAKALFLTTTLNTLLFNGNIFMRFDGYHLLAALWGRPNLQTRAIGMLKGVYEWLAYGSDRPERLRFWVLAYGLGSWLYKIFLYTSIILFLFHFDFKPLAYFLAVIEVMFFVVIPCVKALQEGGKKMKERRTWRTAPAVLVPLMVLGLMFVNWNWERSVPAVVAETRPQSLVSPATGSCEWLVRSDARVEAGQPLVRVRDLALEKQLAELVMRRAEAVVNLSAAAVDPAVAAVWSSRLREVQGDEERVKASLERCILKASSAGVVELRAETSGVQQNQELGRVQTVTRHLRILVPSQDQHWFQSGSNYQFAPAAAVGSEIELDGRFELQGMAKDVGRSALSASKGGVIRCVGEEPEQAHLLYVSRSLEGVSTSQTGVVLYDSHFCLARWFWHTLKRELVR